MGAVTVAVAAFWSGDALASRGQPGYHTLWELQPAAGVTVGVNIATGNVRIASRDVAPSERNGHTEVWRYYNSEPDSYQTYLSELNGGSFDRGWSLDIGSEVRFVGGDPAILHGPDGYEQDMAYGPTDTLSSAPGFDGTFSRTATHYVLERDSAHDIWRFRRGSAPEGELVERVDGAGRRFTVAHDAAGRTTSYGPDDPSKRITFTYRGAARSIGEISEPGRPNRRYGYSCVPGGNPPATCLTSYTAPDGKVTRYTYDSTGFLTRMDLPNGAVVTLTKDAGYRPASLTFKRAGSSFSVTYRFSYNWNATSGGWATVKDSYGAVARYFLNHSARALDGVVVESDFDESDSTADIAWDWRAASGLPQGIDSEDLQDRYRFRRGSAGWSAWSETMDSGFTLPGAQLGEAVDVELQLTDSQGRSSRVIAVSLVMSAGAECGEDLPEEGPIGPELHAGAREVEMDVYTFATPLTRAEVLAGLPAGASLVSVVERTVPSAGGTPHYGGLALAAGEDPAAALGDFREYLASDIAGYELELLDDRSRATSSAEIADIDAELERIRTRRDQYAAASGLPIKSVALYHEPGVAMQATLNYAGQLEEHYEHDYADDDCGPAEPPPSSQSAHRKAPAVARAAGKYVDNRERRVRHDVPPYSGTYSPPSIKVKGENTGDCCRKMTVRWRWNRNRYKRYWWQQPRLKRDENGNYIRRGYEVQVLFDQDLNPEPGDRDGSWGLPGFGGAKAVWTANYRCPYPDDYSGDNLGGAYSLTVGSSCRPRTSRRWLRWTSSLSPYGRPDTDRALVQVQPVHYAQDDLVGGQIAGVDVSESRYCNYRRGAMGSCMFGDRLPIITYCDSYDEDRDSLVLPGRLTFKRRLDIACRTR